METAIVRSEVNVDTGLTVQHNRELTPAVWTMIERISTQAYKARLYEGISSPEAAAMVMLKGYELGLGISASFEFIKPIQGKFELIPRGGLALVIDHPKIKEVKLTKLEKEGQFFGYECRIVRTNGFSHTSRFTMDDAKRAGLLKPGSGYEKYPENMCMYRAIGFCIDVAASDITSGMTSIMKMPEEFGVELTQSGEVIDVRAVPAPEPAPAPAIPATITLESLALQFGGEAVLVANAGKIPATQEELNQVAEKLGSNHK